LSEIWGLGLCCCVLSCGPSRPTRAAEPTRLQLPVIELTVKSNRIGAEVARAEPELSQGLMYRRFLAPDSGMLFIFDRESMQRFWMKNTLIPLSIAFISREGIITDVLEMAPLDTTSDYSSSRPVSAALEMNSGWFESRGVAPGDTIRGIPR
jgi:uncharacterized membrane protein (UPF0127 family)